MAIICQTGTLTRLQALFSIDFTGILWYNQDKEAAKEADTAKEVIP